MKTKTNLSMIALVAMAAGLLLSACGSSKQASSAVSVTDKKEMAKQFNAPAEVEITTPCSGPEDSSEDFIRVNGSGTSKDRTMAKDRAYLDALARLASKLEAIAASEDQRLAVSANADGEDFHDKVVTASKVIAQANVAGYRTACEKYTQTPGNPSYNCYVTIEFGKQKVVKQLYESLNKEKLLKADYDFDRYMKEFNKDLKEYEASRR
jgi:major membrane immunogen (membrane-anchored lipoprotein)